MILWLIGCSVSVVLVRKLSQLNTNPWFIGCTAGVVLVNVLMSLNSLLLTCMGLLSGLFTSNKHWKGLSVWLSGKVNSVQILPMEESMTILWAEGSWGILLSTGLAHCTWPLASQLLHKWPPSCDMFVDFTLKQCLWICYNIKINSEITAWQFQMLWGDLEEIYD